MLTIVYNFPLSHAEIIELFRAKIHEAKQQHADIQFTDVPPLSEGYDRDPAEKKNKIVAVIDSITSNPGVVLPWKEMCRIAREEGVWTVIDAAHSIGQEVGPHSPQVPHRGGVLMTYAVSNIST